MFGRGNGPKRNQDNNHWLKYTEKTIPSISGKDIIFRLDIYIKTNRLFCVEFSRNPIPRK
jgi:hypothetical protein